MSNAYTGGCACGAIRYETFSQPIFENHCQCSDCRHRSGTGHGSYLTFPDRSGVKITGEARLWGLMADSGNEKFHAFCPNCGTPVYLTFKAMPDLIAITASSLDDPHLFRPQVVTYSAHGLAWDRMDPALVFYKKMVAG